MRSSSLLWHWSQGWSWTQGWRCSLVLQPLRSLLLRSKCWTPRNWSACQTCGVKWKIHQVGICWLNITFENNIFTPGHIGATSLLDVSHCSIRQFLGGLHECAYSYHTNMPSCVSWVLQLYFYIKHSCHYTCYCGQHRKLDGCWSPTCQQSSQKRNCRPGSPHWEWTGTCPPTIHLNTPNWTEKRNKDIFTFLYENLQFHLHTEKF